MDPDAPLTFQGALRILGHYERPWLDRLDRLLGGVVVAAPAAFALGPAAAVLPAVAGWLGQRGEGLALIRRGLDTAGERLGQLSGLQRHRLVTAAHTVIVGAAFFEALQELVGDEQYRQLDLSRTEQEWLLTGESGSDGER